MAVSGALGIALAFVIAFLAVGEVNGLQNLSKTLTSGAVNTMFGTTTFIMLLAAVVIGIGGVLAAVGMVFGRR